MTFSMQYVNYALWKEKQVTADEETGKMSKFTYKKARASFQGVWFDMWRPPKSQRSPSVHARIDLPYELFNKTKGCALVKRSTHFQSQVFKP
jgi:hypothetical protein